MHSGTYWSGALRLADEVAGYGNISHQVAQAVGAFAHATTKDTAVRLLRVLAADAEEGVRAKAMETLLTINRPPE